MHQFSRRLIGIAVLILLAVSGLNYSYYGYSMLFPVEGEFINRNGDIAGGDFLVFYNAAVMTLTGSASAVWDHSTFATNLLNIYGEKINQLNFFNPPVALLMWAPFGLLHHIHALWLWTALPLIALGWLIFRLTYSWLATGLTLIAPLTAYTAGAGQTGIVYAVLMAGFMLAHERHPTKAGGIVAMVAIKPHLALAMPFCLLIDRNWRALTAMVATVTILSAAISLVFGFGIWISFFEGIRSHSGTFFQSNNVAFDRAPSILMFALKLGASNKVAWCIQIVCSLTTLFLLALTWRSTDDSLYRAFALALAICLLTPKIMHYDAMVLLVPIAMLVPSIVRGTAEISLVLLAILIWYLPFFEPTFKALDYHPGALVFFTGLIIITGKTFQSPVVKESTTSLQTCLDSKSSPCMTEIFKKKRTDD